MTTEDLNILFDSWTDTNGPVALHLKQKLLPVEGEGSVFFPPTYADIGYNIDILSDGTKVATIDSVGSQANRMEPIFKLPDYASLVPQIEIEYGNSRGVSIFEVGHRLGDALIRSTNLKDEAQQAFKLLLDTGNALGIAKLAPTSLVFGVWDSRDTQAKLPRLVQSVIRAWGVDVVSRAAQYNPPVDYSALEVFSAEDKAAAEGNLKNPLAQRGFVHVPAIWRDDVKKERVLGGIVCRNGVEQDITINLVALRRIQAGDEKETKKLQRYLFGLSLVAATAPLDGFLRQGCLLTPDPNAPAKWQVISRDGKRDSDALTSLTDKLAKSYAEAKAKEFGVGESRTGDKAVKFNMDAAKKDAAEGNKKAAAKKTAPKKTAAKKDGTSQPEGTMAEE